MQKILSKATKIGILEQVDFATVGAVGGTYECLYVDSDSLKVNADVNISGFEHTSGVGLLPERSRRRSDYISGMGRVSFSMAATKQNLALFFAGALHKATEVASTPYQKVITPLYETVVPNFSGAASKQPHIFTLAIRQSALTASYGLLQKAIVDKLDFEVDYNARGVMRLAKINVEMVGIWTRVSDLDTTTFTTTTEEFYNDTAEFLASEGNDVFSEMSAIKTFKLSINNNVSCDVKGAGGVIADYTVSPSITATISFVDAEGQNKGMDALCAGTELIFAATTGSTGVSGYLNFNISGRMTNNDFYSHSNNYDENTITIECEKPASGSCCTVTIADGVDRNWIAP